MREFILNDACLGAAPLSLVTAAGIAEDIERGLADLISAGWGVASMRLAASTGEIEVSAGLSLADVLTHLLRNGTTGRLFARMATKYPVEDDLEDSEFAALVEWSIPAYPGSLSLVLCAHARRIAVSLSQSPAWMIDPITLAIATDPTSPTVTAHFDVDNVFSSVNAAMLRERLKAAFTRAASPAEVWRERTRLFPSLDFAPRVEGDLANLGALQYASAVARLAEIDSATAAWVAPQPTPTYLSNVTGESGATMNKYGSYRVFRSCFGSNETFDLHARLAGGFRLHMREVPATHRVEIGYIGPHLPIVGEN